MKPFWHIRMLFALLVPISMTLMFGSLLLFLMTQFLWTGIMWIIVSCVIVGVLSGGCVWWILRWQKHYALPIQIQQVAQLLSQLDAPVREQLLESDALLAHLFPNYPNS